MNWPTRTAIRVYLGTCSAIADDSEQGLESAQSEQLSCSYGRETVFWSRQTPYDNQAFVRK